MTTVDPKLLSQVRYRCIGPSRGGRVVAVAADPVEKNVFYFGAVAGGVLIGLLDALLGAYLPYGGELKLSLVLALLVTLLCWRPRGLFAR